MAAPGSRTERLERHLTIDDKVEWVCRHASEPLPKTQCQADHAWHMSCGLHLVVPIRTER